MLLDGAKLGIEVKVAFDGALLGTSERMLLNGAKLGIEVKV